MYTIRHLLSLTLAMLLIGALPASTFAQEEQDADFLRPHDVRGVTMFEAPQADDIPFDGFELLWGAAFTQQFQALNHSNDTPADDLPEIGAGFNLATANLYLGAQLAEGIRLNLTTYLSSRHHPESWVKGGYIQVDELSMFNSAALDNLMKYVTLRVGHFEINYGDTHFRRTDNGNALYNPFVGNYIMDPFTTEVGGEVYVRSNGFLAMAGITGGELNPSVVNPDQRAPSFYGKLGVDRQLSPVVRVRLTGSAYTTRESLNNTLHSGDRAGSRYYEVVDGGDWSGRIRSPFNNDVTAFMINPFLKIQGLELFGSLEWVTGSGDDAPVDRNLNQYGVEAIYRFLNNKLYVGGRYNVLTGELLSADNDITVDRWQVGAGWFVTSNILVKGAYVTQSYQDFPAADIRYGAEFDGLMVEGVIAF